MAYDHSSGMIVTSKPSNNQLITGYGLVKVCHSSNTLLLTPTFIVSCIFSISSLSLSLSLSLSFPLSPFSLSQVSLLDLRASEFVGVHSKGVRDVQFSPRGDCLTLTAGMDKKLKLTSMHSNAVVLRSVTRKAQFYISWHRPSIYFWCMYIQT